MLYVHDAGALLPPLICTSGWGTPCRAKLSTHNGDIRTHTVFIISPSPPNPRISLQDSPGVSPEELVVLQPVRRWQFSLFLRSLSHSSHAIKLAAMARAGWEQALCKQEATRSCRSCWRLPLPWLLLGAAFPRGSVPRQPQRWVRRGLWGCSWSLPEGQHLAVSLVG